MAAAASTFASTSAVPNVNVPPISASYATTKLWIGSTAVGSCSVGARGCRRNRHTGGRVREIEKLADVADERRDPLVRRTGRRERRQQVDLRWHPAAVASS